ncbi:MAG: hypothetical protein PHI11_06625 [Gallionella sp.]|nr:hypothetical protein [Gallionella sp.]
MSVGYKRITQALQHVVVLVLSALFLLVVWLAIRPYDLLDQINIGMNSNQVITQLGKPTSFKMDDSWWCKSISPHTCKQLIDAGAEKAFFWNVGIGVFLVVGFDKKDQACFKVVIDT